MTGRRRGSRRRVVLPAALAVTFAFATGACGVPTDTRPQTLRDRDVPFNLLDPSTTSNITPSTVTATSVAPPP